jgi:hypothetical protein
MDRDPTQLRSEISQLIKKQIDTLGKETFGGATDAFLSLPPGKIKTFIS